ncbi:uncharacterized protein K452DRAFT_290699 [Aplosporella prunicola CBS 121167]|uniref:Zn(2)-C6 fungal-type domain-containing protein n=1 Tax=Aplosporella prunicola CBS 121167 TaxID=1176127 RepID=A0A6A6B6F7_9PEZI|nr:uncharacterized protein K452DRAFT_290699 [Aplosporella prunicola CBS 121167]KAF2138557.1 hypothetical protein K452DRAFT_290699 [Aplosporella prunicola CBS 121167]
MSSKTSPPYMSTNSPRDEKRRPSSSSAGEPRRRMACDRCHAQKLRCLRTVNSRAGTDCDRCLRLSARCTYSPPNRMGRPTTAEAAANNRGKSGSANNFNHPSPLSSAAAQGPFEFPSESAMAMNPGMISTSDMSFMSFPSVPTTGIDMDYSFGAPEFPLEGLFFDGTTSSAGPSVTYTAASGTREESVFGDATDGCVRELTNLGLLLYQLLRQVERTREQTSQDQQGVYTRLHNYPIGQILENAQKLTRIVETFSSAQWPGESNTGVPWSGHMVPPEFGGGQFLDAATGSAYPSPESPASAYYPCPLSPPNIPFTGSTPSVSSGSSRQSFPALDGAQMDTSTTFLMLSCYLRLARLYLLFFDDLRAFLLSRQFPNLVTSGDGRLFPGLRLGSLQPYAGIALEISIVVQVSEHMLERLHKAMGWGTNAGMPGNNGQAAAVPATWDAPQRFPWGLVRAVQVQEGMDARNDTCMQLFSAINELKFMLRASPTF